MVAPAWDLMRHLWAPRVPAWHMLCTLEQSQRAVVTFHPSILGSSALWTRLGLDLGLGLNV